jgi:anti-sigma regulatory factor (Ser/Thr protein kinase)
VTGRLGLGTHGSWRATAAAVPAARHLVRGYLREVDQAALAPSAELLISELVTNVVLHVGGTVDVTASLDDGVLTVEVRDSSRYLPLVRAFSETASTGRGMRLVHSLAAEHGIRHHQDGKTIWARITAETAARDDDDLAGSFAVVDWLAEAQDTDGGDGAAGTAPGGPRLAVLRVPGRGAAPRRLGAAA